MQANPAKQPAPNYSKIFNSSLVILRSNKYFVYSNVRK